ncbi:hypothetical protein BT67DRAFT_247703 [Trichocladium antarcticum]|uniref:Uncharacterized protein n=1 Tax=Trichocladium antarcticum TaxID=1450529 RepID=A0AAN6UEB9_9PEZI|nr:hypothetical protein BT67DRAFT_247703 [Trichocladium antarcticum]
MYVHLYRVVLRTTTTSSPLKSGGSVALIQALRGMPRWQCAKTLVNSGRVMIGRSQCLDTNNSQTHHNSGRHTRNMLFFSGSRCFCDVKRSPGWPPIVPWTWWGGEIGGQIRSVPMVVKTLLCIGDQSRPPWSSPYSRDPREMAETPCLIKQP